MIHTLEFTDCPDFWQEASARYMADMYADGYREVFEFGQVAGHIQADGDIQLLDGSSWQAVRAELKSYRPPADPGEEDTWGWFDALPMEEHTCQIIDLDDFRKRRAAKLAAASR